MPSSHFQFNHELEMILPNGVDENVNEPNLALTAHKNKIWKRFCLLPLPILTQAPSSEHKEANIKLRKGRKLRKVEGKPYISLVTKEEQEDAYLMKIIEGYCSWPLESISQNKNKIAWKLAQNTSNIEDLTPQLIVADDEKLFVEETIGNETIIKQK